LLASLAAVVSGRLRDRKLEADQRQISRLLVIADEATKANALELMALEAEFHRLVANCVNEIAKRSGRADHWPVFLAIEHARRSINGRKTQLGAPAGSRAAPPSEVLERGERGRSAGGRSADGSSVAGGVTKVRFASFSTFRTRAEPVWCNPTIGSAEH